MSISGRSEPTPETGDVYLRPLTTKLPRTHLPAGLKWKTGDGHPVNGAARTRRHARLIEVSIPWAVPATCELDYETLSHELGTI